MSLRGTRSGGEARIRWYRGMASLYRAAANSLFAVRYSCAGDCILDACDRPYGSSIIRIGIQRLLPIRHSPVKPQCSKFTTNSGKDSRIIFLAWSADVEQNTQLWILIGQNP